MFGHFVALVPREWKGLFLKIRKTLRFPGREITMMKKSLSHAIDSIDRHQKWKILLDHPELFMNKKQYGTSKELDNNI